MNKESRMDVKFCSYFFRIFKANSVVAVGEGANDFDQVCFAHSLIHAFKNEKIIQKGW